MGKETLVMFNKQAEFKEIKEFHYEGGAAYNAWNEAETYGKANQLYGHSLSSFEGVNFSDFENHEAFKQQLKYLGWKFSGKNLVTEY